DDDAGIPPLHGMRQRWRNGELTGVAYRGGRPARDGNLSRRSVREEQSHVVVGPDVVAEFVNDGFRGGEGRVVVVVLCASVPLTDGNEVLHPVELLIFYRLARVPAVHALETLQPEKRRGFFRYDRIEFSHSSWG